MKWVAGAILLLIAALALKLTLLVYAFALALFLFFAARALSKSWASSVTATRHCDLKVARIGQTVSTTIDIEHSGSISTTWLFCEDLLHTGNGNRVKPGFQLTGKHAGVFSLNAGEKRQWSYQLTPTRRGYYQIGPFVLETGDFFGFNRDFKILCEPHYLTVHPETLPLHGYSIESKRPIGEIVMTHRLFEDPTRISGIRDYQNGDSYSRVHWRATARTGKLQSKVFEPSSLAGATIVIDFHKDSFAVQDEPFRSELAITAAASLANALFQMNQQIGFLSNGRDAIDRIRQDGYRGDSRTRLESQRAAAMNASSDRLRPVAIRANKQSDRMLRILDTLARLEKTDGLTLGEMLADSTNQLPRDATVIVFLSRMNMERALALEGLRRQGYAVMAIINVEDDEHFQQAAGILASRGISASHLRNEVSVGGICRRQLAGR